MIDVPAWGLSFDLDCDAGLAATVTFDPILDHLLITLRNDGPETRHARRAIATARPALTAAGGWLWIHGRSNEDDALVRVFGTPMPSGYSGRAWAESPEAKVYTSHELAVLYAPVRAAPALIAASLRPDRFALDIQVELDAAERAVSRIALSFDLAGVAIEPGASLELPPILIAEGHDEFELVERHATDAVEELGARVAELPLSGWRSDATNPDALAGEIAALTAAGIAVDYVEVAAEPGVSEEQLAALASVVTTAGYRAATRIAPFRDASGAALDCTAPSAAGEISGLLETVTGEWGYSVLFLDGLTALAAAPGPFADPSASPLQNLRRGLELVRAAAGDDAMLIAADGPFGPAAGIVDGMRVTPSAAPVLHATRLALQRTWMGAHWWANDPGPIVLDAPEADLRFQVAGVALSGGIVAASGDAASTASARLQRFAALLPPHGVPAEPDDAGDGDTATTWRSDLEDGRVVLGVFNWGDVPAWVSQEDILEPGEVAFDAWDGKLLGMGDVLLGAHQSLLWQVTAPGKTPRLIGDSASLALVGLFQRQVSGRLQLRNDLPRPRTVAVEARGSRFEVELAGGEMRWFD